MCTNCPAIAVQLLQQSECFFRFQPLTKLLIRMLIPPIDTLKES